MDKCQYPQCVLESEKTWGLVPLCEPHHKLIKDESFEHYKNPNKFTYDMRHHYIKIAGRIPWSQAKKVGSV